MKHQQGFSIIELAVVLTIVGLLIGSILVPLSTQINHSKTQGTNEILTQVRQTLINYAVINNRLPCPASQKETGRADPILCEEQGKQGYLPWAELGVSSSDAWGNPLMYRIDTAYQTDIPNALTAQLAVEVQEGAIVSDVVAIIFSYGKNGQYALKNPLTIFPEAFANVFLEDNSSDSCSTEKIICYSAKKESLPKESDDNFVWLTQAVLLEQLAAAGKFQPTKSLASGCVKRYSTLGECIADLKAVSAVPTKDCKKILPLCPTFSRNTNHSPVPN